MTASNHERSSNRRTISRDLTLGLALMTALVMSVFGMAYQIYYTHREVADLNRDAVAIADEFAEVLARPLWNMDMDTVTQIANAYLSSDFLTGVRISSGPEILFDTIPPDIEPIQWLILERKILNAGETIGTARLLFSTIRVDTVHSRSLMLTLVTIILVTTVIGLGSHQLMKRLVARPLNRLAAGIRTIAAGDYQRALPSEKRSDINILVREINSMAREIDRRESDLKKLREMLKNTIDSMPSILVGVDPAGRVTQWNREAEKTTGIIATQAMNQPIARVFPELAWAVEKIHLAIEEKCPHTESKEIFNVDGEKRFSDITIYPLMTSTTGGAVIRVDDITERVRIEEMMIQSEKMLSVGGLAAGMAHEINNPLAGIMQNIQVMQNRLSGDLLKNREVARRCGIPMDALQAYMVGRNIPEMMVSIMESGKRAAKIVENMLSFSRKSESKHDLNDLAQLLDLTLELAENDYDLKKHYDFRRIKIVREYDPEAPKVPCEATKIQQVFLNILKNGAQAMAENPGSTPSRFILRVKPDGKSAVCVEIEDNGPGMEESIRKRIFEPFYTTKSVGVGTGLGLSVSYFIITENHGGSLLMTSAPGRGSCFVIRLPVASHTVAA
ncbi:putative Histidine kinase [Desulfosarcina cetonica]|uniref:ATP-binding protein n=1 Tax=Desulfosarcina cetonica TaxID=90730 RepID=UPI0006D15A5A|nr:ATP-binding protein [Desulfosarcina cetonica]VTR69890.1 putative Histidine kinase [Desulfosarcina cetonica]